MVTLSGLVAELAQHALRNRDQQGEERYVPPPVQGKQGHHALPQGSPKTPGKP
jgi:hypothetical protein